MVEGQDRWTDQMVFFYNLAQAQRGKLPDHLLKFTPTQLGTFYKIGPETPMLIIRNMNEPVLNFRRYDLYRACSHDDERVLAQQP